MKDWERATTLESLTKAARLAARGKSNQPEVARFLMDAERECLQLQQALRLPVEHSDAWWPSPPTCFRIRDPKPRMITCAPFPDRVVHHVLTAAFEPALERYAIYHSYACWKGKGQHRALRQCQRFARKADWVLVGDIASYFASIPHRRALDLFRDRVRDPEICRRLERALAGPRPGMSQYSHLEHFDTYRVRRNHLERLAARKGPGRPRLQPGDPRRLLEEQPAERAGCEPQQGRALHPQRQPGFSRRELNGMAEMGLGPSTAGSVGSTSRSGPLYPGIDQTSVLSSGLSSGTKSPRPGGGASRVAAGPFLRQGDE